MTRVVPKPPFEGINSRVMRPLDDILRSSTDDTAHWLPMVRAANLALLDVQGGVVLQDGWGDGQYEQNAGHALGTQLRYKIPPAPTSRHTSIKFRVFGHSTDGTGLVNISATQAIAGGGAIVPMALPLAAASAWHEVTVPVDADDQEETLTIASSGKLLIRGVQAEWVPPLAGAGWPAADETLAAGQIDATDDVVPLDTDDVLADAPYGADVLDDYARALDHCRGRQRAYLTLSAPASPIAPFGGYIEQRPFRRMTPIPHRGTTLQIRYYASNSSGADSRIWVQAGAGDQNLILQGRESAYVRRIDVADGAAAQWRSSTIRLPDVLAPTVPARFPGFGHIAVFPDTGVDLSSICIWGPEG